MKLQFVIGILILVLATCSIKPTAGTSGVEGQAFIGPNCPVAQQGQTCPDKPYQATITVNDSDNRMVAQVHTDAEGRFKIPLEPGEYILHPESPNMLPFAKDQNFTVEPDRYTQLTVNYDSGIR
jgi:hypothetical protein